MTIQQAPRGKVAQRLVSATTALVLVAWTCPALAATATETRSDQPMDAAPMPLSADRKLPIQVIRRGPASAVETESPPLDDSAAENTPTAAERPKGPRVEIMLRRIFEEAQARQPKLQQPHEDDNFNAPFAVDKSEDLEDPPGLLEADPAKATTRFPGFGDDELLRYRQQMYRTDI